ncbi:hypothetical protein, conserved [Eimeria tenella]|uniref:Uncharacterized protein n=1 Tax=Eimeria tenella TaxID=5802 RepID=U6KPD4_EIMTE|nr:hypothetical protein, conserved [Eimeria tenella]CDJ39947.1 hypothetical protein, conserved [Eimeria tenella]|eukprot:XP_013230700.1 hypothetical protein, conserved [Eimeria tenella]
MTGKKTLPGLGEREAKWSESFEGAVVDDFSIPKQSYGNEGTPNGRPVRSPKPTQRRSRTLSLWLVAVVLFASMAAKICMPKLSKISLDKSGSGGREGNGLSEGGGFIADLENKVTVVAGLPSRSVITPAPFMAGDMFYFEGSTHLRPQTVPFVLEQPGAFATEYGKVPKAWVGHIQKETPVNHVAVFAEPLIVPVQMEWREDRPSTPASEDRMEFVPVQIRSADAFNVAREIAKRYTSAGPVEQRKEADVDAVNRRFSGLHERVGRTLTTVAMEASRVPNTKFDLDSRELRAKLALLEVGSDVERIKKRQNDALQALGQAQARAASGDQDGQAQRQVQDALHTYKALLTYEKVLLEGLLGLTKRWGSETENIMSNVASVLTSSAFKSIEEVASLQGATCAAIRVGKKLFDMKTPIQREACSKNACRFVSDAVTNRLEAIDLLATSIDQKTPAEFLNLLQQVDRKHKQSRNIVRDNLLKKKKETWIADVI